MGLDNVLSNYEYIIKQTKPISENPKYVQKVRTQTSRLYFLIAVIVIQDFETWPVTSLINKSYFMN
jgi:hypothetical protein